MAHQDKAREQFEEYATRERFNIYRRSDGYVDDYTNMRWTTWKAAFAVREDEISELTNELTKLYEQATEHVKAIVLAREIIKKRMLNPQTEGKLVTNIRDASPSVLAAEIIEALNEGLYEQGEFFEEYGIDAEWSTAQEFLTEVVMALNPQPNIRAYAELGKPLFDNEADDMTMDEMLSVEQGIKEAEAGQTKPLEKIEAELDEENDQRSGSTRSTSDAQRGQRY
jgi:hypothetical protein